MIPEAVWVEVENKRCDQLHQQSDSCLPEILEVKHFLALDLRDAVQVVFVVFMVNLYGPVNIYI